MFVDVTVRQWDAELNGFKTVKQETVDGVHVVKIKIMEGSEELAAQVASKALVADVAVRKWETETKDFKTMNQETVDVQKMLLVALCMGKYEP